MDDPAHYTSESAALAKMERLLEEHKQIFTEDEVIALKQVAARERAWMAVGFLAKSFRTILTYVGFFIGAWIALKAGLADWITNVVAR